MLIQVLFGVGKIISRVLLLITAGSNKSFIIYLRLYSRTTCSSLPIVRQHVCTCCINEPFITYNLCGLSTHKVYPNPTLLRAAWALTSRLHPYSALLRNGYFLWHLLYFNFLKPFPLGSMALCVARTFLCLITCSDEAFCRLCKYNKPLLFVGLIRLLFVL